MDYPLSESGETARADWSRGTIDTGSVRAFEPGQPSQRRALPVALALLVLAGSAAVGVGGGVLMGGCRGDGLGSGGDPDSSTNDADADHPDGAICGQGDDEKTVSRAARIYNGQPNPELCISRRQRRAVGAILEQDYDNQWVNSCTGTIISDTAVLTAAHCVLRWNGQPVSPASLRFAVGTDALASDHVFLVSQIHSNPGYDPGGDATADVALLILAEPVSGVFSDLLPIPVNRQELLPAFVGQAVQNVGFGATEVSDGNSRIFWTVEEVTQVTPGWFQVFGGGEPSGSSVCYGDSGGPSLHLFQSSRLALIGTVSWGDPSCMDYDYFARSDANLAWIEQSTGPLDPCVGVDVAGLCDGEVAIWCEAGQLHQRCCEALGSTCAVDLQGNARCTDDQCGGLTYEGECQGNDAVWCEGGLPKRRRCEPCGQVCGWVDSVLGNYCKDP